MPNSVTITALDDGTFTVEQEKDEAGEQGMGAEPAEGTPADATEDAQEGETPVTCKSIKEALLTAGQMLISGGGEPADPKMEGEDDMQAGFNAVRGTPEQQAAGQTRSGR